MTGTGRQLLSFGLVGAVNTLIHFTVFVVLLRLAGWPPVAASATGYACGLVNGYVLNRRWTFRVDRPASPREFLRYCLVNAVALGANLLLLSLLIGRAGILPEAAQVLAIGGSLAVNFVGNRLWTFSRTPTQAEGTRPVPDLRRRVSWWPYALVLALVAPLVFVNLGAFPLRLWDESRLAINALEMREGGDWIVTSFDGKPDMWNTKPPLLIWVQVAAMNLLGPGDLVLRLPSAVAALATCLLLLALGRHHLRDTGFGLLAALVLATSPGFMGLHAARTADYDALMTLLTTAAGVAFFLFLETGRGRWLLAFCCAQALGLLTKGVGAALFLPALAVYALLRGRTGALLRDRRVYLGAAGVAFVVGGYYLLRDFHNPGYLAEVYDNELGGRYLQAIEGHGHPASLYVSHLWHTRLPLWSALVPAGLVTALLRRRSAAGRLAGYAALLAVSYLAIISAGRTKLLWYDVPAYPWLALLVAAFLRAAAGWFLALPGVAGRPRWRPVPVLLLGALLARPYLGVLDTVRGPDPDAHRYRLGYALKEALDNERDLDGAFLLVDGYAPHCDFYVRLLRSRGVAVARKDWRALAAGDVVLAQDPAICAYLHENYALEVREDGNGLLVCRITAGRGS